MFCSAPITVDKYVDGERNKDQPLRVRCNQCLACRVRNRNIWTGRALMESYTSAYSTFLTLTYRDEAKRAAKLDYSDMQSFWKRLRKNSRSKIRFLCCGEYGSQSGMAHWHAIIFHDLPIDQKTVDMSWKEGFVYVGDVNEKSIGYVTKYTLKHASEKVTTYSKRPALAKEYLDIVGRTLSSHKSGLTAVPRCLRINGKLYALDAWSQQRLSKSSGLPLNLTTAEDEWHRFWNDHVGPGRTEKELAWQKLERLQQEWMGKETL